jgi:uncharacterized Ntn-hydrolase superfamily protein
MTFSLTARCAETGMFGIVVTSSSVCVAARCAWVRGQVGAVASQNITDPGLGLMGLDLLQQGYGAKAAMDILVGARPYGAYRQLAIVDRLGHTAWHSGANVLGTNNIVEGEGAIAAGNLLSTPKVPDEMVRAFETSAGEHLAERLLRGVEAGLAAGGEEGDVKSVGLKVCDRDDWPICELRVDWHDDPIGELRRVWDVYRPQMPDYIQRALDPTGAPSYGVPGDP